LDIRLSFSFAEEGEEEVWLSLPEERAGGHG
jgi:hypothetical protein